MNSITMKLTDMVRPEKNVRIHTEQQLREFERSVKMFGRSTAARKNNESGQGQKDYKAELIEMFNNMDIYFTTKHKRYVASRYRNFFISVAAIATDKDYKAIYEGLISGDPKLRSYRALYQRIYGRYITEAKREEAKKNG